MTAYIQKVTVYTVRPGVSDESMIKKIAEIEGAGGAAKDKLIDEIWKQFEGDQTLSKIVLRRTTSFVIPTQQRGG